MFLREIDETGTAEKSVHIPSYSSCSLSSLRGPLLVWPNKDTAGKAEKCPSSNIIKQKKDGLELRK